VIAVLEGFSLEQTVELLKIGVAEFIIPPLKEVDVLSRMWRLLEEKQAGKPLIPALKERVGRQLIGKGPSFLAETDKIPLIAGCDLSVLISGETGTGKELFARAIHYLSSRANKPFVPISCGAIPLDLVENELFGHVRGAFTGAGFSQSGLIHEAQGGTLFLDDIDCLPLLAQAKFLRSLEEKEYRQLGSAKVQIADVRVIAATNIQLEKAVNEGRFRQDLYHRLNVIHLMLPTLRERREDIPLLARHFLIKHSPELHREVKDFSPETLQELMMYQWPGNVRELEHIIERAVVFSKQKLIQSADIALPCHENPLYRGSFRSTKFKVISEFEKGYIESLLCVHQGNVTEAARTAQKNRRAFWELVRKYNIDVVKYKPHPL
jgi:DNA-binding NtrC family response regulator